MYWDGAWDALRAAAESLRVPVYRQRPRPGCLPADHELAFSRTRSMLKRDADVVVVVGTPLDFRVGFGSFGDAKVVHVVDHPDRSRRHVTPAVSLAGDLALLLRAFADHRGPRDDHEAWIAHLRDAERAPMPTTTQLLAADSDPIKPTRIYGELRKVLDRDAVVVCDGGDFVSYAGKYIDSYEPGCWLDPGPYGCLGTGMGYAIAARIAHPDRQVVVMMGDGAAGFSLIDVDTLVRHGLPVVDRRRQQRHLGSREAPDAKLYGYDVAAELHPGPLRRRRRGPRAAPARPSPKRRNSHPRSHGVCVGRARIWSTSSPTPTTSIRGNRCSADPTTIPAHHKGAL